VRKSFKRKTIRLSFRNIGPWVRFIVMALLLGLRQLLPQGSGQLSIGFPAKVKSRNLTTAVPSRTYDAVIVGAGPGGLTAASVLLDEGLKVCMVDPSFTAGRISEKYREVPSNTKVKMFAQWATATDAFSEVIDAAPPDNPYQKMLTFDQDKGCLLGDAIGVAQMLSDGLRQDQRVSSILGVVKKVKRQGEGWFLPEHNIMAKKVVLAQGSHPKKWDPATKKDLAFLQQVDLETCLTPSEVKKVVPEGSVVGVIGSSHSAVLAMKNLYEIPGVRIVNLYRSPLLYAEYKDDWILYDNTGLKGIAADWSKEILENPDPRRITRINTKAEDTSFGFLQRILKDCTHLVAAVGYVHNPRPSIGIPPYSANCSIWFDPDTGKIKANGLPVPGLYGVGIAWPERVIDKAGNIESAVGWFKFMKFVKRVGPQWAKSD
jgi:thioredoxin reductase